jgi:hypothetical protein
MRVHAPAQTMEQCGCVVRGRGESLPWHVTFNMDGFYLPWAAAKRPSAGQLLGLLCVTQRCVSGAALRTGCALLKRMTPERAAGLSSRACRYAPHGSLEQYNMAAVTNGRAVHRGTTVLLLDYAKGSTSC